MTSRTADVGSGFEVDAESVAASVLSCSHVAELSGGSVGSVATYLPGKRILGVRTTDEALEVHVVAHYGPTVDQVARQVRAAVSRQAGGRRVDVTIEDLQLDEPDAEPDHAEPDHAEPGPTDPATSIAVRAGTSSTGGTSARLERVRVVARPARVTMPPAEPGLAPETTRPSPPL